MLDLLVSPLFLTESEKPFPLQETVTSPKWDPVLATEIQLEPFIFPRVFNVSSWVRVLPRTTSTAHGMSHGNFLAQGNAGFACFSTVFDEIRETVSSSGNRFLSINSARAENTRNFHCFCTFPGGRPDAPDVHREYSKQYVRAQLICTHMRSFELHDPHQNGEKRYV